MFKIFRHCQKFQFHSFRKNQFEELNLCVIILDNNAAMGDSLSLSPSLQFSTDLVPSLRNSD